VFICILSQGILGWYQPKEKLCWAFLAAVHTYERSCNLPSLKTSIDCSTVQKKASAKTRYDWTKLRIL
jgi:hypothetical protein